MVEAALIPSNGGSQYDFRYQGSADRSADLKENMDITRRSILRNTFETFDPASTPLSYTLLQAEELYRFDYRQGDEYPTISYDALAGRPALSASHNTANYEAGHAARFHYQDLASDTPGKHHGGSVILTNAYLDDIGNPQHESSANPGFKGIAISANGHMANEICFSFYVSTYYLDSLGVKIEDVEGTIDGEIPEQDFEFTKSKVSPLVAPDLYLNPGQTGNSYYLLEIKYSSWSTHDVQVGVFDSDLDGMPDFYEREHGLLVHANDALDDLDGDGFSNISEYEAGTLPNDGSSFFKVDIEFELGRIESGVLIARWETVPGGEYMLEYSTDLGTWVEEGKVGGGGGEPMEGAILIRGVKNLFVRVQKINPRVAER